MGIFSNRLPIVEKRNVAMSDRLQRAITQLSQNQTVTETTALRNTAVFACVRIISETVAWLPFPVYRNLAGGGKMKAPDYYLYRLLNTQPNPEMTAFTFRETLTSHLLLWGNAYAYKELDQLGRLVALWPLPPNLVKINRLLTGEKYYEVTMPRTGESRILYPWQVFHIPGLGYDGTEGYSPIRLAARSVSLGMATEQFGYEFFTNGTNVGAVVTHPQSMSDKAYERLKESLAEKYAGLGKSHMLLLLEEGMSFAKNTIPPNDAQFLETRKFQVTDIARIYRMPPHMLADLERASFSNIEHQDLAFVKHTMMPYFRRWEQAVNAGLVPSEDQGTYFTEFLVDAILRGDFKTRTEGYAIALQNGWLNRDEVRSLENHNPIPDGSGQIYTVNAATVPLQLVLNPEQEPEEPDPDPAPEGGDNDDED